VPLLGTVVLD
jgi:hypothetical protein